jgi:glutamate-1-semialdehyde 2,1-aminomutase
MEALTAESLADLEALGDLLRAGLEHEIDRTRAAFCVTGAASLFRIHPKKQKPGDYREAYPTAEQAVTMRRLSDHFLEHGILLPHGAAACLSTAMTKNEVDAVVTVFADFLDTLQSNPAEVNQ